MISRRKLLVAGGVALAACGKRKETPFPGRAFIVSQDSRSLSVLSLVSFQVEQRLAFASPPTAILAHPVKPALYCVTPQDGTIHEIDPDRLSIRRSVPVAESLDGLQWGWQKGQRSSALYALAPASRRLLRINADSLQVEASLLLPSTPLSFDSSPWLERGLVSFGATGAVALLDLPQHRLARMLPVSQQVGEALFRSDGEQILVANQAEQTLSIYTAPDGKLVTHLPLAVRPDRLCMGPDNGQLFITGRGEDAVVVVEPYQTQVAATLLAGHDPGAMAAIGDYLVVANPQSGGVSILHTAARKLIASARVGVDPGFIAFTPDGRFALILNEGSGDVAVLRLGSLRPTARHKALGLFTMVPVGAKPVSALVRAV